MLGFDKWSVEEIRAALEASFSDPFFVVGPGQNQIPALFGEWLRRDFDAAHAWFISVGSVEAKKRLIETLLTKWPLARAREGLQFMIDHEDLYGRDRGAPSELLTASIAEAAANGPAAVAEWFRFLAGEKLAMGQNFRLPDGYDFKALFAELGEVETDSGNGGYALLADWRRQDRDGAFEWLLENKGAGKLRMLLHSEGDKEDSVKWFGQRLEKLGPEQRAEFLESLTHRWDSSHAYLLKGVTDPALVEGIRNIGLQKIFTSDSQEVWPLLESIPDPAQRVETLESLEPASYVLRLGGGRRFDAKNEPLLRKKLSEWGAEESRIETIITKLKAAK